MTPPIVERLRRSHGTGDLQLEAADIIDELADDLEAERVLCGQLIHALRNLREVAGVHIQNCRAFERADDLLAKIVGDA